MAASISVENTGAFSQLISRDYKKIFFDEFSSFKPEYTAVANVTSMDGAYQKEGQLVGLGALQQIGEGQPIPYDAFTQGNDKTIYPDDFGLAIAITENMWDDDQTGLIKRAFSELGKAAAYTRELKFWDLLNSGFVTTKRTAFDSAALIASHTLFGSGGTYSNLGTAAALSMTSLQALYNIFEKMVNEKGVPRPAQPYLLIVPPELRFQAENLLKSEYNPENANMQVNTVGNKGVQFFIPHYLTSTTAYFLVGKKDAHDLRLINRKNLALKQWDEPNKRVAVFQAAMRFQTHFSNWYGIAGNAGA